MEFKICEKGNIHLIGLPAKHKTTIAKRIKTSLEKGVEILNYKKPVETVVIQAQDFFVIPSLGIGGSAIGKSCIGITIDFSREDVRSIIDSELPATIYHEFAHIVRENAVGYGNTLLDSLISEGISCFVEKSFLPYRKIPYIQEVPNEKKLWSKAKKHFYDEHYDHTIWFYGSGEFPNWTGYRLGYLLVDEFMKENDITLERLVRIKSDKILEASLSD